MTCTHEGRWSTGPDGGPSVCGTCGYIRTDVLSVIADHINAAASDLRATVDNTGGGVMVLMVRPYVAADGRDRLVALSLDYDGPDDTLAVLYTDWSDGLDIGAARDYSTHTSDPVALASWVTVLARGWFVR